MHKDTKGLWMSVYDAAVDYGLMSVFYGGLCWGPRSYGIWSYTHAHTHVHSPKFAIVN